MSTAARADGTRKNLNHINTCTIAGVASIAGCSTLTVRRWYERGWMPAPGRTGIGLRWNRSVIDRWAQAGCPRSAAQ
jgi:predicted DNA-binding transcriptional regulator AlpA